MVEEISCWGIFSCCHVIIALGFSVFFFVSDPVLVRPHRVLYSAYGLLLYVFPYLLIAYRRSFFFGMAPFANVRSPSGQRALIASYWILGVQTYAILITLKRLVAKKSPQERERSKLSS